MNNIILGFVTKQHSVLTKTTICHCSALTTMLAHGHTRSALGFFEDHKCGLDCDHQLFLFPRQ